MGFFDSTAKSIVSLSASTAKRVAVAAWDNREELSKAAKVGAKFAATAGKAVAAGVTSAGGYLYNHRAEIGAGATAAGSAAIAAGKGAVRLGYDAGSLAIYRDSRVTELRDQLQRQSLRYRNAIASGWQSTPGAESLAVGGSLLADIIKTGHTPEDVQKAYELAYPHVAERFSFADEAARLHGQELVGLVNGVKGKLFEIKYVDYLNSGELPDGYTAHLASSPIQQGWDIGVSGPDGHIAEVLQLKAADSISYVKGALALHPDIQVITTDEVYDKLVLHGAAGGVSDSDFSNAALSDHVGHAADHAASQMHWAPPVIALALHAFSAYRLDTDLDAKARHFGERSGKSWLCYLLGGAVAATTHVGWLGVVTGIGTRYVAAKGKVKRELCQEMEKQVARNKRILAQQPNCIAWRQIESIGQSAVSNEKANSDQAASAIITSLPKRSLGMSKYLVPCYILFSGLVTVVTTFFPMLIVLFVVFIIFMLGMGLKAFFSKTGRK